MLNVTDNQKVDLKAKIKELDDKPLVKNNANLKAVKLQGKVRSLQSDIRTLKAQLESLKHKEYDCMVLKKDGSRCSRPARVKVKWHGVEINSYLQHSKTN